jgi:hypothetical protein
MVILSPLKELFVHLLKLAHGVVNLMQVKLESLLLNNMLELGIQTHDLNPRLFPDGIAEHVGLHLIQEDEPLVEAYLETTDNCGRTKLLTITSIFVHFIADVVSTREHKQDLMALI